MSAATPSASSASVTPGGAGGRAPWPGRSGVTTSASPAIRATTGSHMVWSRPTPCSSTSVGLVMSLLGRQRRQPLLWASLGGAASATTISSGCGASAIRTSTALMVGPDRGVGDVLERDIEEHARGAALLDGRQQRGRVGRLAEVVTELEGVDQARAVLDLTVEPDDGGLTVRLRRSLERLQHRGVSRAPTSDAVASMPGARSSTKPCPAQGFSITAATTATRAGGQTSRPPSVRISSTTVTTCAAS